MAGSALHLSDNRMTIGERQLTFDGNKTDKSQMVTVEIDLTNPNDLMEKLEMIDLTEEETDILLEKALELNKLLKEELTYQEGLGRREERAFVVSAPASQQKASAQRDIHTPTVRSMSYNDRTVLNVNSLARLQSGNLPSSSRARPPREQSLLSNPYSYHSARPMRSMGVHGTSNPQKAEYSKGGRMDKMY